MIVDMAGLTVAEVLDRLAAGQIDLTQAVLDFHARKWAPRVSSSDAQAFGIEDNDPPGADSWAQVEADSRLTSEQYAALVQAHDQDTKKR